MQPAQLCNAESTLNESRSWMYAVRCIYSEALYWELCSRLDVLQPFRQQPRLQSMTWDHRIAKVAPLAALAIAAFATIVTFAAYYQ